MKQPLLEPQQEANNVFSPFSSRMSHYSEAIPNNLDVKKMQAKLLMDYYKQNQNFKQQKFQEETHQKINYGHYEQSLTSNYLHQNEAKKLRKQEIKQKLSQQYDEMIRLKQELAKQERERVLELENKNLLISPWGRDNKQDLLKQKRIQSEYGKQLEMHIRLQEIQKYEQKLKQKQAIEKYKKQQDEQNLNYDKSQLKQFKKKHEFEQRQNQILGIRSSLNPEKWELAKNIQFEQTDFRTLKRIEQQLYGSGLEQQLRSQTLSHRVNNLKANQPYQINKNEQQKIMSNSSFFSESYNPITNPIQINYKNPNILRMLTQCNY